MDYTHIVLANCHFVILRHSNTTDGLYIRKWSVAHDFSIHVTNCTAFLDQDTITKDCSLFSPARNILTAANGVFLNQFPIRA